MKWGKFRPSSEAIQRTYTDDGVRFSHMTETAPRWWTGNQLTSDERPLVAYLAQLVSEDAAVETDDALLLPWTNVYALLSDESHFGSLPLLALPQRSDWVPRLESTGALSDPDFRIAVRGWSSAQFGDALLDRQGAVLQRSSDQWLMSEPSWKLLGKLSRFAREQSSLDADQILRTVGEIRQAALASGAVLDDFLDKTDICTPDKVKLDLRRDQAFGLPVIEVRPLPNGAPDNFVETFDRYGQVRGRYDLIQAGGRLTHVAPSHAVRRVLEVVKGMPARRLSAEQARIFTHNPYAILGDEAAEALDEEQFNTARRDAGLAPARFEVVPEASTASHVVLRIHQVLDASTPEDLTLDHDQAKQWLAAAGRSRAQGLPVFHQDGSELLLDQAAEHQLALLAEWVGRSEVAQMHQAAGEVLDLSAFSSRVIGFDSKVQAVPYVPHRTQGKDWLPDDDVGVVTVNHASGEVRNHIMTATSIDELEEAIGQAKDKRLASVRIPGSDVDLPIPQAESLVDEFRELGVKPCGKNPPKPLSDPKPNQRVGLRIHHNIESLEYVEAVENLVGAVRAEDIELPTALRPEITLLPHQAYGLAWMQQRYLSQDVGIAGCLLADDMGLGKTLQSLSLIAWAWQRSNSAQPSLVVAPVSLLENWKQEVNKFLDWPDGAVLSLYGSDLASKRSGGNALDDDLRQLGVTKLLRPGFANGYRLVLTTYETLRDYELSIARQHWDIVVCDEAQKIKNPTAFVTQAAKALHANFKIACTGTPVENSLADLWCLFDFFQPGCLGALNEFTKVYRESIEFRQEGHETLIERLRAMIQPWVLRRMKNEVHEGLPRKIMGKEADRTTVALQMSPVQRLAYMDAVAAYRQTKDQGGQGRSVSMLNLLHRLRMICAHPLAATREDHERLNVKEHIAASPKLAWLLGCLDRIRILREKVIVFTDYRDLQRLLQRAIEHQFGIRAQIINGSTSIGTNRGDSRQYLIDDFQAKPGFGVLILSASAVGFGVNIQGANHVIHFTRTWNPAKEDQATDRAYRIGQRRDVYVYCPTVAGPGFPSFEQRLAERLDYKRDLSKDMLAGSQELTADDFDDL